MSILLLLALTAFSSFADAARILTVPTVTSYVEQWEGTSRDPSGNLLSGCPAYPGLTVSVWLSNISSKHQNGLVTVEDEYIGMSVQPTSSLSGEWTKAGAGMDSGRTLYSILKRLQRAENTEAFSLAPGKKKELKFSQKCSCRKSSLYCPEGKDPYPSQPTEFAMYFTLHYRASIKIQVNDDNGALLGRVATSTYAAMCPQIRTYPADVLINNGRPF